MDWLAPLVFIVIGISIILTSSHIADIGFTVSELFGAQLSDETKLLIIRITGISAIIIGIAIGIVILVN